jgi:GT2 family glycosyltransferase
MSNPLLTIVIVTRNRPGELRTTLEELQKQDYKPIELVVIDDASDESLESLVLSIYPAARFYRHGEPLGCAPRRTEGFALAKGDYIVQLDDDSCFTGPTDLTVAVQFLERRPEVGALAFYVYNGRVVPANLTLDRSEHYVIGFLGAGVMFRKSALTATCGYRTFFANHGEEHELSIQLLRAGWATCYFPHVVIHHRVSPKNRHHARTWMRGLRNTLWTLVLHLPLKRLPFELAWKLFLGVRDSVFHLRPHRFLQAVGQFLWGLPSVIKLRRPMTGIELRRYDALRFRVLKTPQEFEHPPACTLRDVSAWFRTVWRNRPRSRPFWDRRPGDLGRSPVVGYDHNHPQP